MMGQKKRIGFIGLGIMGKSMALNLIKNGYKLTVFNRNSRLVEELVARGAFSASSPKEVAEVSEIVVDMVTDAPDVEQVLFGKNGVMESSREGLVAVDMSTNSPDTALSIASRLKEKGIEFLDAPVTGGDKGAKDALLTIMAGGKKETFDYCLPVFRSIGKEIVYMGPTGSGQAAKLCNQVAVSLNTLATCEALLLGKSFDLDLVKLLAVLSTGAASSSALVNIGPKIIARDYAPGFKAAHLKKDLKYVMKQAEKLNLAMPGSSIAYQLINAVVAQNDGEAGTSALAKVLEKLACMKIT